MRIAGCGTGAEPLRRGRPERTVLIVLAVALALVVICCVGAALSFLAAEPETGPAGPAVPAPSPVSSPTG